MRRELVKPQFEWKKEVLKAYFGLLQRVESCNSVGLKPLHNCRRNSSNSVVPF